MPSRNGTKFLLGFGKPLRQHAVRNHFKMCGPQQSRAGTAVKSFRRNAVILLVLLLAPLRSSSALESDMTARGTDEFSHSPAELGSFRLLHVFSGPEGSQPAKLVLQESENFLGVTTYGGENNSGTIFEATTAGAVTTLFDFADVPELINPLTLVRATDGAFYGYCKGIESLPGSVFRYEPGGSATVVFTFDTEGPPHSLIAGSDGFLYGTTGLAFNPAGGVFRLSTAGELTVIHEFHQTFAGTPRLNFESADGNFYGNQTLPAPSIFRVSPTGDFSYVVPPIYTQDLYGDIIENQAGDLIATRFLTDSVQRVTKAGEVTTLHNFYQPTEGRGPLRIIEMADGNFIGITSAGGEADDGTIYEMSPDGGFVLLHHFDVAVDGWVPSDLVAHPDGNFYGLTQFGPGIAQGIFFSQTPPDPAVLPIPTFLNVSTRAQVGDGDAQLINGFIVSGTTPKTVLLRAIGPSLAAAGLPGTLADPILELHAPDGTVLSNDNWTDSQAAEIEATGLAPGDGLESAILATLAPGAYTAVMRGQDEGTGTGLVETYGLDVPVVSQLVNTSARGFVGTGDEVMIDGIISSGGNVRMLIRAIGPELTALGVAGALQDTTLDLYDRDGALIASNDNWRETQEAEIEATTLAPGDDREAAILANLLAGSFTAIMSGKDGTTGVALIETYNLGL